MLFRSFDPYGKAPPEIVKKVAKNTSGKQGLPYTEKDIQSLMNNACGYYCLALGHFINASQFRSNDLYSDVHAFMEMFDELMKTSESPKIREAKEAYKDKEQGFDQKGYDAIQNKIQKQPFEVNIRVVSSAKNEGRAEEILNHNLQLIKNIQHRHRPIQNFISSWLPH